MLYIRDVERAPRALHEANLKGLCDPFSIVEFYCFIPKGISLV